MKHCTVALCSLLSAGSLWSAQAPAKEITIYNKNIDGDIRVDRDYVRSGQSVGYDNENHLTYGEKKTLALYDAERNADAILKLDILSGVPRFVNLNITEDGHLKFGDTITIEENKKQIQLKNQTGTAVVTLAKKCEVIKIGSNPSAFPFSNGISQHTLKVFNKNLLQVMILYKAVCAASYNEKDIVFNSPFPVNYEDQKKVNRHDHFLEKITYRIAQGEQKELTTLSSQDNPAVVGAVIKLLIPQAAQNVQVRINNGQIQSGDTLTISTSDEDNKIMIVNNRTGELLAKLYSNDITANQATLG